MSLVKKSANNYIFGLVVGEGAFSTVYLAKDQKTNNEFAIKVCEKRHIQRHKKQLAIMRERRIMKMLTEHPSPFFIKLICTFQDHERLYFVMNYAKNGELSSFIKDYCPLEFEIARFYSAEILLALEHLHRLGIVHRDLKPENILLNEQMHIQISDFGSAVVINTRSNDPVSESDGLPNTSDNSTSKEEQPILHNSFVGTAHYVSPEMLNNKKSTFSSDLWALGCIIYQMIHSNGLPPFRASNEYLIFQKIINLKYEFPEGFNEEAKSLVEMLLKSDPAERLGAEDNLKNEIGYSSIKQHPFFLSLRDRWSQLHNEVSPKSNAWKIINGKNNEESNNYYEFNEPGLQEHQITRLLGLNLNVDDQNGDNVKKGILDISPNDMSERLENQRRHNKFHRFVENNLILKQGFVDKKKGLFARRRMLLLTTGPHLYYVDAANMVLKGQIPWSPELRPEAKNFKTFYIHTPNRTYFLEDIEEKAPDWCEVIDEVKSATYPNLSNSTLPQTNSNSKTNKS